KWLLRWHPTPLQSPGPALEGSCTLPCRHRRCCAHRSQETGEECNTCWVTCFSTSGIDVQELRKGKNILAGYDLVPEPKITVAAYLCLNDFASTVHIIEIVKNKAGPHKEIYPCVLQELRPTLNELGISSPEELGLHKV
ncbi:hypothetical protein K5549_020427, partial [Capra hircus]|uniref:Cytochrome c oxidase subunit 5A, mitochondrial n=1 Tax=Capra hircus TaxID=9925 RepID=A0A452FHQ7_CAPHI